MERSRTNNRERRREHLQNSRRSAGAESMMGVKFRAQGRTRSFLQIAAVGLLALWSNQVAKSSPQDDAVTTIRRQYADWQRAYEKKDLPATMEIFAPDAISTFGGAPDSDVTAIRRSYEQSFTKTGPVRRWKPVDLEIGASVDLAYALADWQ